MKKLVAFLAAVILFCGIAMPAQSVTIDFDEFISSPPTQDLGTPYYDDPITDEYAAQGIHFSPPIQGRRCALSRSAQMCY